MKPQICNHTSNHPIFGNENPIDIVLVLLKEYPQIETWIQGMEHNSTVTTSRTLAIQFLESLMNSQPQFAQLIKLIRQQLKQRRQFSNDSNNSNQQKQNVNENATAGNNENNSDTLNEINSTDIFNCAKLFNFLNKFYDLDHDTRVSLYDDKYDKKLSKKWRSNNKISKYKLKISRLETLFFNCIPTKYLVDNWTNCNLPLNFKKRIERHLKKTRKYHVSLPKTFPQNNNMNEPPLKKRKLINAESHIINHKDTNQTKIPMLDRVILSCGYCKTDVKYNEYLYRCGQCKNEYYCNVECQTKSWNIHKFSCDTT
eukprot:387480_1